MLHPDSLNASKQEVSTIAGRRGFMTGIFTAGLGVALAADILQAQEPPAPATSVSCDTSASAADALLIYMDRLQDIEMASLREARNSASRAYWQCSNAFNEIRRLAQELEDEFRRMQNATQLRQISELAEAALASVMVLKAANVPATIDAAHSQILVSISEQVDRTAQNLLPAGQNALSPRATDLIEKLLAEIRRAHDQQEIANRARVAQEAEQQQFNSHLNCLRTYFVSCITATLELEAAAVELRTAELNLQHALRQQSGDVTTDAHARVAITRQNVTASYRQADDRLRQLIVQLERWREQQADPTSSSADRTGVGRGSPCEQNTEQNAEAPPPSNNAGVSSYPNLRNLILLVKGTQQWLKNNFSASHSDRSNEVSFISATYRSVASRPGNRDADIRRILQEVCGSKPTDNQVRICRDALVGAEWIAFLVDRESSILWGLRGSKCMSWLPANCDASLLASKFARL